MNRLAIAGSLISQITFAGGVLLVIDAWKGFLTSTEWYFLMGFVFLSCAGSLVLTRRRIRQIRAAIKHERDMQVNVDFNKENPMHRFIEQVDRHLRNEKDPNTRKEFMWIGMSAAGLEAAHRLLQDTQSHPMRPSVREGINEAHGHIHRAQAAFLAGTKDVVDVNEPPRDE